MKTSSIIKKQKRSVALILVGSIVIVAGVILLVLAVLYARQLGIWGTLLAVLTGFSSVVLALTAIIKNEPAWLLIDLITPL